MTRDEIAQAMQDTAGADWGNEAHFQRFAKVVLETEREECAKLCKELEESEAAPWQIIEAIRARGET